MHNVQPDWVYWLNFGVEPKGNSACLKRSVQLSSRSVQAWMYSLYSHVDTLALCQSTCKFLVFSLQLKATWRPPCLSKSFVDQFWNLFEDQPTTRYGCLLSMFLFNVWWARTKSKCYSCKQFLSMLTILIYDRKEKAIDLLINFMPLNFRTIEKKKEFSFTINSK